MENTHTQINKLIIINTLKTGNLNMSENPEKIKEILEVITISYLIKYFRQSGRILKKKIFLSTSNPINKNV